MLTKQEQIVNTYSNLNNWRGFRLRLFAEGILVGCCSGLVISFFRFCLHVLETERYRIYHWLSVMNWSWTLGWIIILLLIARLLYILTLTEPLASGSGIQQVKGAILGLVKMNWLRIIWVKLIGGLLAIGAGLSLGREGPSIQLGASTAQGVSRFF